MIRRVEITRRAEKQLRRLPVHIGEKLLHWVYLVMEIGLEEVRDAEHSVEPRIPGDVPAGARGGRRCRLRRGSD